MEHTTQFLMGMFAAYYGCEMAMMPKEIRGYYLRSICYPDRVEYEHEGTMDEFNIRCFKPILTPLSEMSDEDLIRILGWEHHKDIEIRQKQASIDGVFCSAFCTNSKGEAKAKGLTASLIFDCLPLRHTDYLRSKKYDCGYLHISSLIQAGLAVKTTKHA